MPPSDQIGQLVHFDELPDSALVRLNQLLVSRVVPFSASTAWRRIRDGTFPQPIRLSPQITAFRVGEIRQWLRSPATFLASTPANNGGENE